MTTTALRTELADLARSLSRALSRLEAVETDRGLCPEARRLVGLIADDVEVARDGLAALARVRLEEYA